MSERRPPPIEEPDKPLQEMTPAERRAYFSRVRRTIRDDEVHRGTRRPKTMREFEVWRNAQAEREQRRGHRIARAERAVSADAEQPEE